MSPFAYTGYLVIPVLAVTGYWLGGTWNFITPAACFIIHPVLNLVSKEQVQKEANIKYPKYIFTLIAMLYVPVVLGFNCWALLAAKQVEMNIAFAGFIISAGIVNGVIGFTLAHEFIHRHTWYERSVGYLLLLQNLYMHYGIEHVKGHHVYACTSSDPHTARNGESFYHFLPRAILQTFRNAWLIEKRNNRHSGINVIILFSMLQLSVLTLVFLLAGIKALLFILAQAFIATTLLHVINYLQHYGLLRKRTNEGKYERMSAHHSWNSGNKLGAFNLFQLDNHADHHMHPDHHYESLKQHHDSPKHPTGYSGMIVLAFIPPLWFRVINKAIVHNHKDDLS